MEPSGFLGDDRSVRSGEAYVNVQPSRVERRSAGDGAGYQSAVVNLLYSASQDHRIAINDFDAHVAVAAEIDSVRHAARS